MGSFPLGRHQPKGKQELEAGLVSDDPGMLSAFLSWELLSTNRTSLKSAPSLQTKHHRDVPHPSLKEEFSHKTALSIQSTSSCLLFRRDGEQLLTV